MQSLETDAFIMVLRRFLNTRGNVKQLRSDNGSNFIGAERERRQAVKQWNHGQIEEELQVRATVNGYSIHQVRHTCLVCGRD